MTEKTNWDDYYRNSLHPITRFTRRISTKKLLSVFEEIRSEYSASFAVCELGGANSCFAGSICEKFVINRYHVVDTNIYGLGLLGKNKFNAVLTSERADVTKLYDDDEQFDLVYSAGLIEHFDSFDTGRSIESHFARCKSGGYVIIIFPTPTWMYRLIRSALELLRMWQFPDERPLTRNEVIREVSKHGMVRSCSINWWIGLTQCYIVAQKV